MAASLEPLEMVGPFIVVCYATHEPARHKRVVVRCTKCQRVSILAERTLLDKHMFSQEHCFKCRSFRTRTTWTTGRQTPASASSETFQVESQ